MLLIGCLSTSFANGGGKKKSTSKPASKQATAKKSNSNKVTTVVLQDTIQSPAKAATAEPKVGFKALFVNAANGVRLNPKAISFVQDYMEKNTEDLLKIKERGRPYFNMMDGIFTKYGLPTELKYLAVIESELKSTAVSWAGAVGPWQLMPVTARELGLVVNRKMDERKNYTKSTTAAARYLKDLYEEFGDWLLVIAAYNGGPGNVYSAIRKSGSRNFWKLQNYLPAESRKHVKKFIGTHYIMEGQGSVTTLTKAEATEQIGVTATYLLARKLTSEELSKAKSLTVSGKYCAAAIANNIAMSIDDFNRYNPDFDKKMATEDNTYELKLPADKMDAFMANKYSILNESVQMLLNGATVSGK
ncbi:MAG: lytic transglycosylase domain-containing protein [Chitinophagaceae bacterium]